jgi:hypothetical protein
MISLRTLILTISILFRHLCYHLETDGSKKRTSKVCITVRGTFARVHGKQSLLDMHDMHEVPLRLSSSVLSELCVSLIIFVSPSLSSYRSGVVHRSKSCDSVATPRQVRHVKKGGLMGKRAG